MNPEKRKGTKLKSTSCSEKKKLGYIVICLLNKMHRKLLMHYGRLEKNDQNTLKSRLEYEEHEKQQILETLHLHKQF